MTSRRLTIGIAVLLGAAVVTGTIVNGGVVAGGEGASDAALSIERGRQLFNTGKSASGDDFGVFLSLYGDKDRRFPGERYACINCHGDDGMPSTEGGVGVPNIQAHRLGSPAHAGPSSSRNRPKYDSESLSRAIRHGVDSGGNRLNAVMPRFDISDRDMRDLQAYLATLGTQQLAGMTRDRCVLGLAVSDDPASRAAAETIRAFCIETNKKGGIYGRKLELVAHPVDEWPAHLATPEDRNSIVGLLVAGTADELDAHGLPVITLGGEEKLVDPPDAEGRFYLHPSQATQLCVAVDHVTEALRWSAPTFALVAPEDSYDEVFQVIQKQVSRTKGATLLDTLPAPQEGQEIAVLLAGDPAEKLSMIVGLAQRDQVSAIYCTHKLPPGKLGTLPPEILERLRLLLPVPLPSSAAPEVGAFQQFLARHKLAESHVPNRVAAMAGGIVLAEALKRCGARASRERLVRELQAIHGFKAGLFAPVSFSGGRNVGVRGAQVVLVDPKTRAIEPWSDWKEPR